MIRISPIAFCLAAVLAVLVVPVIAIAGSKTTSLQLTYQVEWGDVDVRQPQLTGPLARIHSSLWRRPGPSE